MSEPRHIKKVVRPVTEAAEYAEYERDKRAEEIKARRAGGVKKTSPEPLTARALPKNPFPDVPAGMMRRGAITTQKVEKTREYTPHSKPRAVAGFVTLSELAAERGIQAQLARLWLKKAEIKKPKDGWRWKIDSRELKRVRLALGFDA